MKYSRKWSPSGWDGLHEAVGLWVLSTAAAGRVAYHDGRVNRTSLYLLAVAQSTLFAKSETVNRGMTALEAAGLDHLLIGHATPHSYFDQCLVKAPDNYDTMSAVEQARVKLRLRHAAQRGWDADEFGSWAKSMMREGSVMHDFRRLLLKIYDEPKSLAWSTRTHGTTEMQSPSLALMALTSWSHLQPIAGEGSEFWSDGLLARFAVTTPPPDVAACLDPFPEGECVPPAKIVDDLRRLDDMLGHPKVTIETRKDDDDKRRKITTATVTPPPPFVVTIEPDARQAANDYRRWLTLRLQGHGVPDDMAASYGRMRARALKIAALIAAVEREPVVDLRRWRIAQAIVERQRLALHWAYERLTGDDVQGRPMSTTDRVLEFVADQRIASQRTIHRHFARAYKDAAACSRDLHAMVLSGDLHVVERGRTKLYAVDAALVTGAPDDVTDPPST